MRPIDADKFDDFECDNPFHGTKLEEAFNIGVGTVLDSIDEAQTLKLPRGTGHWIKVTRPESWYADWYCSKCGHCNIELSEDEDTMYSTYEIYQLNGSHYCPACGAKMMLDE